MSKCDCGQVEIPLGAAMCNYGGEVHAVTACTRSADWKARAEKAEAAIARVRDVMGDADDLEADGEDLGEHILRALDGDGDE